MAYIKQTWNNDDPLTPLSAGRLGYLEEGVETAQETAEAAATAAATAESTAATANTKATTADTKATTADSKAVAADAKASTAQTAAETADGKAVAAQTRADAAHALASTANNTVDALDAEITEARGNELTLNERLTSMFEGLEDAISFKEELGTTQDALAAHVDAETPHHGLLAAAKWDEAATAWVLQDGTPFISDPNRKVLFSQYPGDPDPAIAVNFTAGVDLIIDGTGQ